MNTGQVLGGLQFENEIHKSRCQLLSKQIEMLEKKMELFKEQQSMFNYLRNDLRKYKDVFQKSIEHETMYSPITPIHKYTTA